jgi:hypothetical protein
MQSHPTLSIAMRKTAVGDFLLAPYATYGSEPGAEICCKKKYLSHHRPADMEDGELRMRELVFAWTGYCRA